jgi:hypothetical protein
MAIEFDDHPHCDEVAGVGAGLRNSQGRCERHFLGFQ